MIEIYDSCSNHGDHDRPSAISWRAPITVHTGLRHECTGYMDEDDNTPLTNDDAQCEDSDSVKTCRHQQTCAARPTVRDAAAPTELQM